MPTTAFALLRAAFPRLLYFSYLDTMRRELSGCRSCLDIGCGAGSPARHLGFDRLVGMDGHGPTLEAARRGGTHDAFVLASAGEPRLPFEDRQFDCCIALDLIEHLDKQQGLRLIREMERVAAKRILVFTPNGFLPQQGHDGDLQEHLSGWSAAEMRALGFEVIGMLGPRFLRGEQHRHRLRPAAVSGIVAAFLHVLSTRRHAEHAAAILCVKDASPAASRPPAPDPRTRAGDRRPPLQRDARTPPSLAGASGP
jgi:SAM-dependent methyltransferase